MSIKGLNQYFENIRKNPDNDDPSDDFMDAFEEISKLPNIANMTMNPSSPIILLELSGELQAYTHAVVMSVIGALIRDEIL